MVHACYSSRCSNFAFVSIFVDGPVDPVYLALKQATGKYGSRRGSSVNNLDSATPSPGNLSQVSLQDSGFAEMSSMKAKPMLGSTPQLDNSGPSAGRRRAPKLTTQMKSLSLDCQEMPPRINTTNRSPMIGAYPRRKNDSSDLSDWERSCSPCNGNSRRSSAAPALNGGYIVIHEYAPPNAVAPLVLGERVYVVDNGDPDWLHGFREHDRTESLLSFPATCVAMVQPGEQAMKILQNVAVPEMKLRLYRDQVVFAQPDSLHDGKVTIRTAHKVLAPCPLSSLALI
uniref:SH3 domain-containing protein n=1 Tax=Angiostrongylus cantonensis TaxID=6313 RepID=A0A158PCJ3_ANGCA